MPASEVAHHLHQLAHLAPLGDAAGHGPPVRRLVVARARGREPHGPRGQRVGQLALHHREVRGGGRLRERALAHGVGAQRRVADIARVVDALRPASDGVEVLRVRLPRPLDAGLHRLGGDVLGALEVAHDQVPLVGPAGRQREAAVAHDDAGHPVPARARAERIPRHLRVHVGVAVDEARGDDPMARVDLLASPRVDGADARDTIPTDADVGAVAREPGAIDHGAAANDKVVRHVGLPASTRRRARRARPRCRGG